METLQLNFPGTRPIARRAHVGVVASGDLEVLLSPAETTTVTIRTSVDGFGPIWRATLERFFARHPVAMRVEINDAGATPGVVTLRLAQALEETAPSSQESGS
ncbi:malonate decarboxylase subunit delta [Ancylobacter sp.]|uniref:malonate decarboxylase subunit delta n=1 Tax=Ancylobacter sp. TaxID=1872567 RepID=UPI003D13A264